jgi:hypothetical protein
MRLLAPALEQRSVAVEVAPLPKMLEPPRGAVVEELRRVRPRAGTPVPPARQPLQMHRRNRPTHVRDCGAAAVAAIHSLHHHRRLKADEARVAALPRASRC